MAHAAKSYDHLKGGALKGLSDAQLEAHFTLYKGYVTKLNEIEEKWPRTSDRVGEEARANPRDGLNINCQYVALNAAAASAPRGVQKSRQGHLPARPSLSNTTCAPSWPSQGRRGEPKPLMQLGYVYQKRRGLSPEFSMSIT